MDTRFRRFPTIKRKVVKLYGLDPRIVKIFVRFALVQ
jgi:hypothetical protein